MKVLNVEVRYPKDSLQYIFSSNFLKKLPKNISIGCSVQFLDILNDIKLQLDKQNIKYTNIKTIHGIYKGQILGCDISKINSDCDAFLYIGDGLFHPKALAFYNEKKVFIFNPLTGKDQIILPDDPEIIKIRNKINGGIIKYYSSNKIGILVSTKFGQNKLNLALKLKEELKQQNKEGFIIVSETLDFNELENFPFIECYINTMCPRIALDDSIKFTKPVINIENLSF